MRIELLTGTTNVMRFPVERRARPTLDLLREIEPDVREVLQVAESFQLPLPGAELRDAVDEEVAEHILPSEQSFEGLPHAGVRTSKCVVVTLRTTSIERAVKVPKRLHAGTVWVNAYRVVSYLAPFGGVKGSGMGRENGIEAIKEYLEAKSVFINGNPDVPNPFVMG